MPNHMFRPPIGGWVRLSASLPPVLRSRVKDAPFTELYVTRQTLSLRASGEWAPTNHSKKVAHGTMRTLHQQIHHALSILGGGGVHPKRNAGLGHFCFDEA